MKSFGEQKTVIAEDSKAGSNGGRLKWRILAGVVAVILFFVVVVILFPNLGTATVLRQGLMDQLKDPASADFRNEELVSRNGDGRYLLCGEVNAKNGFGGFTGFKRFISTSGMAIVDDESDVFSLLWQKSCVKGGGL